ncbi:sulfatase-like hydrolase/transferase [Roseiconus lacunae]|uniref:Sulfatase-like hydrolase/transferase n=1 Tax=Roseiconus lacunae TaxID=2605694 RepID=A0ABT7PJ60_9BACT|nr:sulfatase-like hydrolase/transferase [Roseiconus lacunae]MDM4016529.1 sulfatase-like hydrolase/transferase [Roseiconus lacunae]
MRVFTFIAALVFGTLTVISTAAETLRAEVPNIVWINAEDMSPHLGCYGHPDARTPRIDQMASQGVVYHQAFATAPICSPSRSCLATGLYATSLGTQHLRCEVEIPSSIQPLAIRLRQAGYYCTNTGKSDYNFSPDGIWDRWTDELAPWEHRKSGQPFFGFITIGETHEGRINLKDRYDQAVEELKPEERHDPGMVTLPPFYPDTPEIRRIFAGMYDLATVFDHKVGAVLDSLEQSGDLENTFVFVFGDHGNGLPRYKRWLNDSGLRVPLIIHVPEKYRRLCPELAEGSDVEGSEHADTDRLVSFVDFPATALALAGCEIPPPLQGVPFLGTDVPPPRRYVFGARSRADDMFEISRSVFDGRYLYVRHFLPHLPYIQDSVIFDDRKASMRELRRLNHAGELAPPAAKMWADQKPVEELYDLQTDPHELINLADQAGLQSIKSKLRRQLKSWMLQHRDSGLLTEAEYQRRAHQQGTTPFDIMQSMQTETLTRILDAAWQVGKGRLDSRATANGISDSEAAVRYWSCVACTADAKCFGGAYDETIMHGLIVALGDDSPSVRIAAAEALLVCAPDNQMALTALGDALQHERPWVALEAASTLARLGKRVSSLRGVMQQVIDANRSAPGSPRPYKNFNYASFTGWALEIALERSDVGGDPQQQQP